MPVVSTVAPDLDVDGQVLNVNADTAAAAIAVALGAEKLVVLTDVEGIYADWPDRGSLLSTITVSAARELLSRVDHGMVPKLEACIRAVEGGVPQTHVVDGRKPHSILLEIFTDEGIGTMVLPDITGSEPTAAAPRRTDRDARGGPMTAGSDLLGRYAGAMVQVFGTPQLVLASGHGCWVTDVDGKRYLDLLSGIAVNALGHGHPALVQAVTKQAESAIHVSNFFTSEPAIALAERHPRRSRGARRVGRLLRQLRHRGDRGRDQALAPHRAHPHRRARGLLPRPLHRRPRPDPQGRLPRAVRAAHPRGRLRPAERRRRPARAPSTTRRRRSSSSRSRARPGCASCRPTTCASPAR